MLKQRYAFIDVAKYVAMLSVILGHFMQCLRYGIIDAPRHWEDYLFRTVCAYEMPLFIGISGYFTYLSLCKTPISSYVKSRFKYLFVPLCIWTLLNTTYHLLLSSTPISFITYCSFVLERLTNSLWFIWAILYSSIIIATFKKFKIDNICGFIVAVVIIKAIPFQGFCYASFKDVFVFFVIGYWVGKQDIARWSSACIKLFPLFVIISILGVIFWQPPYILHPVLSLSYWVSFLYNIILSTSCSIVVLIIVYYIYKLTKNSKATGLIANIGSETLGIYLLQDFFFRFYGYRFNGKFFPEINNLVLVLIAILFMFGAYYVIKLIEKSKVLSFLMLGKKTY